MSEGPETVTLTWCGKARRYYVEWWIVPSTGDTRTINGIHPWGPVFSRAEAERRKVALDEDRRLLITKLLDWMFNVERPTWSIERRLTPVPEEGDDE